MDLVDFMEALKGALQGLSFRPVSWEGNKNIHTLGEISITEGDSAPLFHRIDSRDCSTACKQHA